MIGEEPFNVTEDTSKVTVEDNGLWIDIITSIPTEDGEEVIETQSIDPADLNNYIAKAIFGSTIYADELEITDIKDLGNAKFLFSFNITITGKTIISLDHLRKLVK